MRDDFANASLLLGNGASRAIWSPFNYDSLYEMACSDELEDPLSDEAQHLFDALGTTNFENVLATLRAAEVVAGVLGWDTADIEAMAAEVRRGVIRYDARPARTARQQVEDALL